MRSDLRSRLEGQCSVLIAILIIPLDVGVGVGRRREEKRREEKKKRRNMPVYLVISSNHPLSTHRVSKRVFLRLSVRVLVLVRNECRDVRGFSSDS